MGRNLPEITGMRGVASLLVVAFHAIIFWVLFGQTYPGGLGGVVTSYGWIGVDFFFVLSGFLLALPLLKRPESALKGRFWAEFMGKRWIRIAPPYYLSLFLLLALFNQLGAALANPKDLALHLVYAHAFTPDSFWSINPSYWTLAIEFQFYLVLPFLAYAVARRSAPAMIAAAAIASLAWRGFVYSPTDGQFNFWAGNQLPGFLLHFTVGVAAAKLFISGGTLPLRARYGVPLAVAAFIVAPLWLTLPDPAAMLTPGLVQDRLAHMTLRPLLSLGFAAVIFYAVSEASAYGRFLGHKHVESFGQMSYSLYLLHMPLQLFFILKVPAVIAHGFWPYFAAMLAVSIATAAVYYVGVEKPSLKLKFRLFTPAPTSAPASAAQAPSAPAVNPQVAATLAVAAAPRAEPSQ